MYSINEDIFNTFNEESLYLMGYLFADAAIYRGAKKDHYTIVISSNKQDVLRLIKNILQSEHPIYQVGGSWKMYVNNKKLILKLEELGLGEHKIQEMKYPNIPTEMELLFIRGYFAGKGTFILDGERRVISSFSSGNREFLERIRDRLVTLGLNRSHISYTNQTYIIKYYVKDTQKLYNLLYCDTRIYSCEQKAKYDNGVENLANKKKGKREE